MSKLTNSDIPCPPPDNFRSGPPLAKYTEDKSSNEGTLDGSFPPKGNGEGAFDAFIESIWGVPDGRRKG